MSIMSQVFAGPPPQVTDRGALPAWLFGTPEQINPASSAALSQALVNTTVFRCNSLISQTNAALPVHVIGRGDKTRTEIREPAQRYIWGQPNFRSHRINMWESAWTSCVLKGDAFLWQGKPRFGADTDELYYLPPGRVEVGLASDQSKVFRLDKDDRKAYTAEDILHIPALSTNGITGIGLIDTIAPPVNAVTAARNYGKGFYDEASVPSGLLKSDQILTRDQADELKARWQEQHGAGKRGVAVLGYGAEYQAIAVTQEQAQYIETLEHWEVRIAQAFGIPPHMVGIVDRSTSWGSGIEQQTIAFVTYTLLPWLIRFEQAIEDDLLPESLEMKFILNGLLRGDTVARFSAYRTGIAAKFLVPNEARALEDMSPLPGGDEPVDFTTNKTGLAGGGGTSGPTGPRPPTAKLTTSDADDLIEAIERQLKADHYAERVEQEIDALLEEGHCPQCSKLLARRINRGAEVECKRCREIVAVA